MRPLLKCRIIIRTASYILEQAGVFRSTVDAIVFMIMFMIKRMNELYYIKVEVIR